MKRGEATRRTAESIRNMIVEGRFADGTPLRQSKLAEELGVSRVPLREAFQLLEAEGLVELRSNRGAVVQLPSPDEISQLAEVRVKIECWLLQLAIPYANESDFEALEGFQKQMEVCTDEDWSEHNIAFHDALLAPAGRPYVIDHLHSLHQRIFKRFHLPIISVRDREKMTREHWEILDLYRNRELDAAASRLESHILISAQPAIDRVRAVYGRRPV
ncbi:MAG: GntR family transcriptional regulator [Pseudomonadota bacterium]